MRACPHLAGKSGIYMIFNSVNNKIYIGKTKCFYKRCHQYLYDFRERKIGHLNNYLYNAMNKIGIENFDFIPLEFCDLKDLTKREEHWINKLNTLNRNCGYNLRMDDDRGLITNPETSKKMSDNLKKQWRDGLRNNHSKKLKENWENNPQRKELQSELFTQYKTKYEYLIYINDLPEKVNYRELVDLGFSSVLSNFHRRKTNDCFCKGVRIVRVPYGESYEVSN